MLSAAVGYGAMNTCQERFVDLLGVTVLTIVTEIRPVEYRSKLNRGTCLDIFCMWLSVTCYMYIIHATS